MDSAFHSDEFRSRIQTLIRVHFPHTKFEVNEDHLMLDGERFELALLWKLTETDRHPAGNKKMLEYMRTVLDGARTYRLITPALALANLVPRIVPSYYVNQHPHDHMPFEPWLDGAYIVYAVNLPQSTHLLTTERMVEWELEAEILAQISRINLEKKLSISSLKIEAEVTGKWKAFRSNNDGITSCLVLTSVMRTLLDEFDVREFAVAIPDRNSFIAGTMPSDRTKFCDTIAKLSEKSVYPACSFPLRVVHDGVCPL